MNNVECTECHFAGICKHANDIALARIKASEYGPHDPDGKVSVSVSISCDYYKQKEK